jgi:hypothetical protein
MEISRQFHTCESAFLIGCDVNINAGVEVQVPYHQYETTETPRDKCGRFLIPDFFIPSSCTTLA